MSRSRDLPPTTKSRGSYFFQTQLRTTIPKPPPGTDLSAKVAVITGGSSGLGLEAGRHFLQLGLSHLILAVRSPEKGSAAAASLSHDHPRARIEVWPVEMTTYSSIQGFVARCDMELSRIDIVILNAGTMEGTFEIVEATGHEKVMQVNYWSTALLALLLIPVLSRKKNASSSSSSSSSPPPHMMVANSVGSLFIPLPDRNTRPFVTAFDDPCLVEWDYLRRYKESKAVGQLFFSRLAEIVPAKEVIINMVEPGLSSTSLFRYSKGIKALGFGALMAMVAWTPKTSALTYVDAAVVRGVESHGCFLVVGEVAP
jgi:NAD(P)-dependent dehydrogenase (short-subunit alcohol dehydrogenase family)